MLAIYSNSETDSDSVYADKQTKQTTPFIAVYLLPKSHAHVLRTILHSLKTVCRRDSHGPFIVLIIIKHWLHLKIYQIANCWHPDFPSNLLTYHDDHTVTEFGIIDSKNFSTAYVILYELNESSPSHWQQQQVEEQAPKPVGWKMCFLLMTFVPVQKLCVSIYIYIMLFYISSVFFGLPIVSCSLMIIV